MTSYNRVILTGKVANSPRRHYRPDGSAVIQFPLELDEVKDLPGQEQPQGDRRPAVNQHGSRPSLNHTGSGSLIDIVAFGKLAEFKFNLLQSGHHVLVVGRLNQRQWQTPEGRKRTRTEVIATELRKLEETNNLSMEKVSSMEIGEKDEETY